MRFFTASCDSSWDGPTPEPAKCPFTNPYGVFYTAKSERDEVEERDDGYMMFTRRSEIVGSGQGRVEGGADNQEADGNGIGGLGLGMVFAMQDGMRDSRQGVSQEPLLAINALLDASYSQGFTDASLLPPPYEVRNSPSRWDSVLSPTLCAFAAKYPMVTIAGLGAVSAATFLGAAGLTGIALRRLGSAPLTRGRGIEGRLDDLERRLAQGIASANVQRRSELEGLKKELLSIRRINGKSETSLPNGKVDLAAAKAAMSSSAPIAPGVEEARLSQVITEAVEAVLAARQPAGQTTSASVAGTTKDGLTELGVMEEILASADDHAEALSDKLDEVLDAIEQLQNSVRGLDVRAAGLPKTGVDGHPVMSVNELAKAVQGVKEEFKAAHPAGEPAETLVKELETAAESIEPRAKPLAPEIHKGKALEPPEGAKPAASAPAASPEQRTGGKTFTTATPYPSGDERARLLREAASAANRAHTERHEATEHCIEAERQSRNHEREAMVAKMRKAAEDNARRMKELAGKTWGLAGQAKKATEEVGEAADEVKAEAESLAAKSKVIKDNLKTDVDADANAEGDKAGRIEGIKGLESAAKSGGPLADIGGASATSEPVKTETSAKPESSTPQPSRPKVLYGVDDSGDWSFSLFNAAPEQGWHEVPIVLRRASSAHSYERGLFWRHYSDQRSHAAYSTKAKIYFYPEANMVELDGAMWRCGREGDKYVIRENISKRAD